MTPWTVAHLIPLSRQEYWSGLAFPVPGTLTNPGTEPSSFVSPALAGGDSLSLSPLGSQTVIPEKWSRVRIKNSVLATFEVVSS